MEYPKRRILCLGKNIAFHIHEITLYQSLIKRVLLNLGSIYAEEKGIIFAYHMLMHLLKTFKREFMNWV